MNWTEFKAELKRVHTYWSTRVAFIASTLAAFWLQLPPESQSAIMDAIPFGRVIIPVVVFGAFYVARATPQAPRQ